jgi:hypothetical protein
MIRIFFCLVAMALFFAPSAARAQSQFATPAGGGNNAAQGSVNMCLNGSNQAVPCSSAVPLVTSPAGGGVSSNAVYSAQKNSTTTASPLTTGVLVNGITIKAASANTGLMCFGPAGVTSATGYCLAAGESIGYSVANANQVYEIDTLTTDKAYVTGN